MKGLEKIYQKSYNIISQRIDNEIVLIPIKDNIGDLEDVSILNEVGVRIWELIDGKKTTAQINNVIIEEFVGVSEEQILKDTLTFIKQLEDMKAIETS